MTRGNKDALLKGEWDDEEAEFIMLAACDHFGVTDKDVMVECDSGWFIVIDDGSDDEPRTYSVQATTGPESVCFEAL